MYKAEKTAQMTFEDFNQSCGMRFDVNDEWVVVAGRVDRNAVEKRYMEFFPSKRGCPALGARMALGALIIQHKAKLSDRNLVKEVARNPYYQYFIGLATYQTRCPFRRGVLPELRKRFGMDFLVAVNETLLKDAKPTPEHAGKREGKPSPDGNLGTMILDALCSPSNIRHPQDLSLLNKAREKHDSMIDRLHPLAGEPRRTRTYRKALRKRYLAMAKAKRRPAKRMRSLVRVLLCAVKRNVAFVDAYLAMGAGPHEQAGRSEPGRDPQALRAAEGDVRRGDAQGCGPHCQHHATVSAPDRARQGEVPRGVRREI